jgi:hypothetical protein
MYKLLTFRSKYIKTTGLKWQFFGANKLKVCPKNLLFFTIFGSTHLLLTWRSKEPLLGLNARTWRNDRLNNIYLSLGKVQALYLHTAFVAFWQLLINSGIRQAGLENTFAGLCNVRFFNYIIRHSTYIVLHLIVKTFVYHIWGDMSNLLFW